MVDVFDEVEEQLRSERYRTLFRKGWPVALGLLILALLVAGGIWGWRAYQTQEAGKASITYSQAMDALAKSDNATAEKLFTQLGKSGPAGFKSLALMQVAAMKMTRGDSKGAVELFDQAASAAKDPLLADAARLKAAYALLDTAPLEDSEKRLTPLIEKGRPYAALAREALGVARLGHGKLAEAKADFAILAIAPDASDGIRNRARAATLVIEAGQAGVLPDLAKKAAALPPLPTPPEIIPNPNAPPPAAEATPSAPAPGAAQ